MVSPRDLVRRNYATGVQSAVGTQAEVKGDHAIVLETGWNFTPIHNNEIRNDYHPDTRDPIETIPLEQGPHDVTGEGYLLGAETQGNAPDLTGAFLSAFTETTDTATTQNGLAGDTVTVTPTSDNWSKGQIIKVAGTGGTVTENRYAQIYASATGNYTIWPPLLTALADTNAIKATCNYELANNNTDVITVYTTDDDNVHGIEGIGTFFNQFDFTISRGAAGKISLTGKCREIKRVHATTLNGGINDSVTTVVLTNASCEAGTQVQCESEKILLGTTSDNLTFTNCERGFGDTSAAAHNDSTAVTPIVVTDATAGSPIYGWTSYSGIWLGTSGSASTDIYMPEGQDLTISINEMSEGKGTYGDGGLYAEKLNGKNREISIGFSGYLERAMMELIIQMVQNNSLRTFVQMGEADGRACAFGFPAVEYNPPAFDTSNTKEDKVFVRLESRAVLYDSTNSINACTFCF